MSVQQLHWHDWNSSWEQEFTATWPDRRECPVKANSHLPYSYKSLCHLTRSSISESGSTFSNQENLKLAPTKLNEQYLSSTLFGSNFFTTKTVKHWKSLPSEAVSSLSLEIFKTRLDKALSNLVWPCNWPCFQQEDGWYPEVPSSLNYHTIPQALRHSSKPETLTTALLIWWNILLCGSGYYKKEIFCCTLFLGACFRAYFLPSWRDCSWTKNVHLSHLALWYEVILSTSTQQCREL